MGAEPVSTGGIYGENAERASERRGVGDYSLVRQHALTVAPLVLRAVSPI